jgi:UDP-glucose 4-epimerase
MSKRILITGATGYIGSHTIVELVNAGYDVVGVDNFFNSTPRVLDGIKKILGRKIDFVEADCADLRDFEKVFRKYGDIEGVIHFAAYKAVGESVKKPLDYYRNNLNGLLNVVNLMSSSARAANIVFSSSCTVYGQPSAENLPITEEAPIQPATSPYGKTKQMSEEILKDCVYALSNLKVSVLRYFNPIGAHPSSLIGELPNGVPQNLIPFITQTAAGIRNCLSVFGNDYNTPDGSCIRDYIYVVDLAKAHVKALERLAVTDERIDYFNLGTGKGVSVLELVHEFMKATGVDLNYKVVGRREGDVEQVWADPSKANRVLGWKADTPLDVVLESAWKWQQAIMKK